MAHHLLRHAAAAAMRTERLRKKIGRKVQPVEPVHAVELHYRWELTTNLVKPLREAGRRIAADLRSSWAPRRRVADGSASVGDADPPELDRALKREAARFGRLDEYAAKLASDVATRALRGVDARLVKNLAKSIGVDLTDTLDAEEIKPAMAEAIAANVDLIKSIPSQYFQEVEEVVTKTFRDGMRWEDAVDEIQRVGEVTSTRAKVIARDQMGKLNSSFNQVRQTGLGIEEYEWRGVGDQRERDSHKAMEGQRCRWNKPPIVDGEAVHPGQAILCRCSAVPIVDLELVETAEAA